MAKDIFMGCPMIIEESTLTPAQGKTTKSVNGVGSNTAKGTFHVDFAFEDLNHSGPNDGQMQTLNQSNPHETGKYKAKHNSPKGY